MSQGESPNLGDALRFWEKRLAYLEIEKVYASAIEKWTFEHHINQCKQEIQRLENELLVKDKETNTSTDPSESNPRLRYRQKVYKLLLVSDGKISSKNRLLLSKQINGEGITQEDADIIETEALQLYQEYQSKLKLFEQLLNEVVENVFFKK